MGHDGVLGARLEALLNKVEPQEAGYGAGVSVFREGSLLGQAWIGEAAPGRAWSKTTPVLTWSVSKGIVSILVALLARDGPIDPDCPISTYWPEFGSGSKNGLSLMDVMTHQAGLAWLPKAEAMPSFGSTTGWVQTETIEDALATMASIPDQTGQVGYHALTFGWLIEGCLRRATGKGLNAHLQHMIGVVDGIDMSFGTRSSAVKKALAKPGVPHIGLEKAAAVDEAFADAENPLRKSLCVPTGMTFSEVLRATEDDAFLAAETPAMSLISDANSLARVYSLFATAERVDGEILIDNAGRDEAIRGRAETDEDAITGGARKMAVGFVLNSPPSISLAPGDRVFGHPGMGGSLAWGDPETGLGFAYLTNASIPDTVTDARAVELSNFVWSVVCET